MSRWLTLFVLTAIGAGGCALIDDFSIFSEGPGVDAGRDGGGVDSVLWLMENDRSKLGPFLDQSNIDSGRLRLLADALKGRALAGSKGGDRTDEQKAIDRLLAQWSRVIESRAMPLLGST